MKIIGFISIISGAVLLFFIFRAIFSKRKSLPVELFAEALRNENKGDYEAAIRQYETALAEESKSKFPSNSMQHKINDKLKVLRTVISYQENFQYENKLWVIPKH
jgi:hypothetical protein